MLFLFSFWHPYDSDVGTFGHVPESSYCLLIFFFFKILFICFEREGKGEKEEEKHQCVRDTSIGCLLLTPNWGPVLAHLLHGKGWSLGYSTGWVGQPTSLLCGAVCEGGVREGTLPLAQLSLHFQSFSHFLYATGTLPAATLVLNPSMGRFLYVLVF